MKLGAKIFGALSSVFLLFLLVGLLLPGSWTAEVDTLLPFPPSEVFEFVNRIDRLVLWNPMPESGLEFLGAEEGVGSGIQWDDPEYGEGQMMIVSSEADTRVEYDVLVEGGSLRIHGVVSLRPNGTGTTLHWSEEGDFGWNPLMGYTARGMADAQAQAMRSSLETLRTRLEGK